jgi:hypothetical protein
MAACWIAGITLSGSGALDGSIISSVTSSGTGILTFSPGSITTGFANDIVVSGIAGYCAASGTNAINLSYTLALSTCAVATMDGAIGYKIITAAGSTNPQWSVSNGGSGWAGIVGWNLALKGL